MTLEKTFIAATVAVAHAERAYKEASTAMQRASTKFEACQRQEENAIRQRHQTKRDYEVADGRVIETLKEWRSTEATCFEAKEAFLGQHRGEHNDS